MTKKLLILTFLFFSYGAQAQYIQNIRFEPQYPGPTDSVLLILDLQFTSGDCLMSSENHVVSSDSIRVEVFHCPGPLAFICDVTDTINLGVLAVGQYATDIIIHRKIFASPDPCAGSSPVDSSSRQLIVYSSTGVNDIDRKNGVVFYHSQSRELMISDSNKKNGRIMLFNVLGSMVMEKNINTDLHISTPNMNPGIYIYKLIYEDGSSTSGKFAVQ